MEIHTGRYTVEDDRIAWTWLSTSCEEYAENDNAKVIFGKNSLNLVSLSGSLFLERPPKSDDDESLGAVIKFGCLHPDGTFEQRGVKKL